MRVDAHLHVWRSAERPTPGIATLVPPQQDVPLSWAALVLAENHVHRGVLVQPIFRSQDNSYVADCAASQPDRWAAVCVVDPRQPEAAAQLKHWVARGCRGLRLRPAVADEESSFGHPDTFALWQAAQSGQVVVNLLCQCRHATTIARLAERFEHVPILIDHLGQPRVDAVGGDPDFPDLLALARHPNVWIKLSGLYHFSRQADPLVDCGAYVQAVCEAFGPARLLWGSDFPHVTVRGGYARWRSVLDRVLSRWSTAEQAQVLGGTASQLYWPSIASRRAIG